MRGVAAGIAAFVLAGASTPAEAAQLERAPVPGTICEVFPADNVWRMNVSRLPKHPKSRQWKRSSYAGRTDLHPDFGPPAHGMPYDVVDASQPRSSGGLPVRERERRRTVSLRRRHADRGWVRSPRTDDRRGHVHPVRAVQRSMERRGPRRREWRDLDLASNVLRPRGWTSADAAGLPILPGLVRWDEVHAGEIDPAIRFTVSCTSRRFVWPARHQAGQADRRCPPMGARFRLKGGFDVSRFSPNAKVVLRAMKRYGLIVADNGSDWYFQGTRDLRWRNGLIDQLKRVPAGAFVAVDARGCRVGKGSARFAYGSRCPGPS